MRVFVLTAGRTASQTVALACEHINGMTAAHESRRRMIENRLDYPDNHVEVDNRLAWFLGSLERLYSDDETFYVFLRRDPERVAASYIKRWHITVSIVRAFYHGILMCRNKKPTEDDKMASARLFVQTVEDNITAFLSSRTNYAVINTENLEADFLEFMDKAGLEGDRDAISEALNTTHNLNKAKKTIPEKLKAARFPTPARNKTE
ncbi:hypothetical protein DES49_0448 [Halospina denitrificans]|uniref:Sulfotransferase family protein n=1 Tax=Halospina denitrificans TaxID=332522 RepID=A0A4R7K1L9_9GAMM|nr:hypothetical protein [Halospina denitrificans]TDT44346.1 hypothetical protein DES49_0448 [Halospina denitrificans]